MIQGYKGFDEGIFMMCMSYRVWGGYPSKTKRSMKITKVIEVAPVDTALLMKNDEGLYNLIISRFSTEHVRAPPPMTQSMIQGQVAQNRSPFRNPEAAWGFLDMILTFPLKEIIAIVCPRPVLATTCGEEMLPQRCDGILRICSGTATIEFLQ